MFLKLNSLFKLYIITCYLYGLTLKLVIAIEENDVNTGVNGDDVQTESSNAKPSDPASPVVEFNAESFDKEVPLKPHFVMFFSPWCGHCKRLHPTWDKLGEKYNTVGGVVTIGKVDCTQHTPICAAQEVNGYPTLKFFYKSQEGGIKYRGPRDLQALEKFIAEQLGLEIEKEEELPASVSSLVEFTDTSFLETVQSGKFFIKFYAPWCGHCKRLEPTWTALAESLEHDTSVVIGKLDCTKYKSVCADFDVKGYPTLIWIEDGKKVAKYAGARTHEDLKRFVVDQLGEIKDGTDQDTKPKTSDQKLPEIVVTLTAENFENAIAHGLTFVKYFAPWCGHCKRLAPTFEELGKKFIAFDDVTISKVDCTQDVNRELCSEQQVNGFPTLYLYKDGEKEAEYSGDRSLDDLAEFIMSRVQPHDEL